LTNEPRLSLSLSLVRSLQLRDRSTNFIFYDTRKGPFDHTHSKFKPRTLNTAMRNAVNLHCIINMAQREKKIEADSILVVVRRKCELIDTTFLKCCRGNKKEYKYYTTSFVKTLLH